MATKIVKKKTTIYPRKDYYKEALRYIDNAKTTLREKAGKKGDYYSDSKYVKTACNTAWNGVLVALDGKMIKENCKITNQNHRMKIELYQEYISKRNRTIAKDFRSAYNYLHLFGGYDGDLRVITSSEGIKLALKIIEWCK